MTKRLTPYTTVGVTHEVKALVKRVAIIMGRKVGLRRFRTADAVEAMCNEYIEANKQHEDRKK